MQFIKHGVLLLGKRPLHTCLLQQLFDLVIKRLRRLVVAHEHKCGIIARNSADEPVYLHAVERGARPGCKPRKGLHHEDVLRNVIREHTLFEYIPQLGIKRRNTGL